MNQKKTKTIEIPIEYKPLFNRDWREAAIYGGRFCLAGDTLVTLANGEYKTIDSLVVGDTVLSKEGESDIIVDIQMFESNFDPKPVIILNINGTITKTTYDHKYFNGQFYVPIYQLTWGIMDECQRRTLELLCQQYGEITHNELQGWLQNVSNETSNKQDRILDDSSGWKDAISSSDNSKDIHTEPREQGDSQSQKWNKNRQSARELRVGDSERAIKALVGYGITQGRTQNGEQFQENNRKGSERITTISLRPSNHADQNDGRSTERHNWTELRWDSGFTQWKNLEISTEGLSSQENDNMGSEEIRITVEGITESIETYDITTQKHHNFFANGVNVSNSLKSHTVGRLLLIRARMEKTRIACFREYQNSIAESSHQLLSDLIKLYELTDFEVTDKAIVNRITGSDFIFKGLHHNEQSVKSIEGIDIAWVEEAQTVSEKSIEILTPTVRKEGSQIIYTYNRLRDDDPIHRRLVIEGRPNTLILNVNYDIAIKYGYMPQTIRMEMEDDKINRPGLYSHKWLGEPISREGKIYKDWQIIDEIPKEARYLRNGLDFGYSNDPTGLVAIFKWNDAFVIDELLFQLGLSNRQIADVIKLNGNMLTIADSAEPKSIDEISMYGVPITGALKGAGSVLQGIQFIQDQKIFITKRSVNILKAYNNYLWATDKEGKNLNEPDHLFSDLCDAIRYGISYNLGDKIDYGYVAGGVENFYTELGI